MAVKERSPQTTNEWCAVCGHETDHAVSLEIRTEGSNPETDHYSREPYRLTRCLGCGERRSQRMNNA
jgi:ribosomal protein L44E